LADLTAGRRIETLCGIKMKEVSNVKPQALDLGKLKAG
jgi:hypothetical protein